MKKPWQECVSLSAQAYSGISLMSWSMQSRNCLLRRSAEGNMVTGQAKGQDVKIEEIFNSAVGERIWSGLQIPGKDNAWKALEWGRHFEEFGQFMYSKYGLWKTVAESQPYKAMHDAIGRVDRAIVPDTARLIEERGMG